MLLAFNMMGFTVRDTCQRRVVIKTSNGALRRRFAFIVIVIGDKTNERKRVKLERFLIENKMIVLDEQCLNWLRWSYRLLTAFRWACLKFKYRFDRLSETARIVVGTAAHDATGRVVLISLPVEGWGGGTQHRCSHIISTGPPPPPPRRSRPLPRRVPTPPRGPFLGLCVFFSESFSSSSGVLRATHIIIRFSTRSRTTKTITTAGDWWCHRDR